MNDTPIRGDDVKRTITVEIQDTRGKTVKFERTGDEVNITRTSFRQAPISIEQLRRGLRELGIEQ